MKPIRILTYNLRMNTAGDGENSFDNRKEFIRGKLLAEKPDLIGFQEVLPDMYEWLRKILGAEYALVGYGRGSDFGDEANPVAFRRDRYTLMGFEQIWLSPTPYEPGSRFELQSGCPRVCVCAALKSADGVSFRFFNTHLDHESESARVAGIREIFDFIMKQNAKRNAPFILTGDFNAGPDSETLNLIRENRELPMCDATENVSATYHAYGKETPVKIDYIIVSQRTRWQETHAWTDTDGVHYLSDHYPVETVVTSFLGKSIKKRKEI